MLRAEEAPPPSPEFQESASAIPRALAMPWELGMPRALAIPRALSTVPWRSSDGFYGVAIFNLKTIASALLVLASALLVLASAC
jgi:hypothetical protein